MKIIKEKIRNKLTSFLRGGDFSHKVLNDFISGQFLDVRARVAAFYLPVGRGLEIGALHQPLVVPSGVKVTYVDRLTANELLVHYPELELTAVPGIDVVDDGEELGKFKDSSQDFVIANHFIEHCENPIKAVKNALRVLRKGGILYLGVPDKEETFDKDRPTTTLEHLLKDFNEGPAWSKKQHFEEWVRLVNKVEGEDKVSEQITHLLSIDYSIHYHVWSREDLLKFLIFCKEKFSLSFRLEFFMKNGFEVIVILRKC